VGNGRADARTKNDVIKRSLREGPPVLRVGDASTVLHWQTRRRMKVDERVLAKLADYDAWRRGGPAGDASTLTLFAYAGCVATPDLLLGFAELFRPELTVRDGVHFIAAGFSDDTYAQWKSKGLGLSEIQRVMNHVHIARLLQSSDPDVEVLRACGRVLAEMWSITMAGCGVRGDFIDDEEGDVQVTFVTLQSA
jgi:hypothetical protein